MHGLWKEKTGGWNNKDSKRKKQKRKHTLKDKGRAILKTYEWQTEKSKKVDKNKFRYENEQTITYIGSKFYRPQKIIEYSQVFRAEISFPLVDENNNFIYKNGIQQHGFARRFLYEDLNNSSYHSYNHYFIENTNSRIRDDFNLTNRQMWDLRIHRLFKTNRYVKLDFQKIVDRRNEVTTLEHNDYLQKTFLYNELLPDWKRNTFYNDGKRRKIAQKIMSRKDRALTRAYLSKKNWDEDVATHKYTKTISWLIH